MATIRKIVIEGSETRDHVIVGQDFDSRRVSHISMESNHLFAGTVTISIFGENNKTIANINPRFVSGIYFE